MHIPAFKQAVTIGCLLMVRDESFNIRHNLPLWNSPSAPFFDAFVVAVDERTVDDTWMALEQTVPLTSELHIFNYSFTGFGPARTLVFEKAWEKIPHITHVMAADPDWQPNMKTITKSEVDFGHDSFSFSLWDRNGLTIRQCNWLVTHRPGLTFEYYIHEYLTFPQPYISKRQHPAMKLLSWEVSEVESDSSWHQTVGHGDKMGASRSTKRLHFDLGLLLQEQNDSRYRNSSHTLYYLGVVNCALAEKAESFRNVVTLGMVDDLIDTTPYKNSDIVDNYATECKTYLARHVDLHLHHPFTELTWGSLRFLGYANQYIQRNTKNAEKWYRQCIIFDPERIDCKYELSRLYGSVGRQSDSYRWAMESLFTEFPRNKAFMNNFYIYSCSSLIQASRSISEAMLADDRVSTETVRMGYSRQRYVLAYYLGTTAVKKCVNGFPVERLTVMQDVSNLLVKVWAMAQQKFFEKREGFVCAEDDGSPEVEALRIHGGGYFICTISSKALSYDAPSYDSSSTPPIGGMLGEQCNGYVGVCSRSVFQGMNFRSCLGLGNSVDIDHYLYNGDLQRTIQLNDEDYGKSWNALFVAGMGNLEGQVKSACRMSVELNSKNRGIRVVVGFGGVGSNNDGWKVLKDGIDSCEKCGGRVQEVMLGDFNFDSHETKYDYVDLGGGLLSLEDVASPLEFLKELKRHALKEGGGVGVLLHAESGLIAKTTTLRMLRKSNPSVFANDSESDKGDKDKKMSLQHELSSILLNSTIGYTSPSLITQTHRIIRGFTLSSLSNLFISSGLPRIVMVGSALYDQDLALDFSHHEFYASFGDILTPKESMFLGENSVLLCRSSFLNFASNQLNRRYSQNNDDGEKIFDFTVKNATVTMKLEHIHLSILKYLVSNNCKASVLSLYKHCSDELNMGGLTKKGGGSLNFEEFRLTVGRFRDIFEGVGQLVVVKEMK